jgi:formylglycine-generating enzyme required for sulfatase activity
VLSFIEKINNETKLNFALPSADQWKFAAKGGNKTQEYTYCGSNTPGDVAWYSANTSSKQNVKTKAPNELGIFDMSGNVGEFVSSMYSTNSSSYKYPYIYGGAYNTSSKSITKTSSEYTYEYAHPSYCSNMSNYSSYSYTNSYCYDSAIGFRLILTCP